LSLVWRVPVKCWLIRSVALAFDDLGEPLDGFLNRLDDASGSTAG